MTFVIDSNGTTIFDHLPYDFLREHADHLRTELDHLEVPPSFIENMNTYLKESLAQANAGAQAQ